MAKKRKAKAAEAAYVKMAHSYWWWTHKWKDMVICPKCFTPIHVTKRTGDNHKGSIVDYLSFIGHHPIWVEVKGKPDHIRLPINEIDEHQIDFMESFRARKVITAIFIVLGKGRYPNTKAWLISWAAFYKAIIACKSLGQKSLHWTRKGKMAKETWDMDNFNGYELTWVANVGWQIPETHPLLVSIPNALEKEAAWTLTPSPNP